MVLLVLLALCGTLAAFVVDAVARRRVPAQPASYDLAAEAAVAGAVADPALTGGILAAGVRAEHFVDAGHRRCFEDGVRDAADAGAGTVEAALPDPLVAAANAVVACAADREQYPGRAAAIATGDLDRPLRRPVPPRSAGRVVAVAAVFAAFAGAVLGRAAGWAAVALLVWFAVGTMLALVDLDTLLLDLPGYTVGYGAAWLLAAVAGGAQGVLVGVVAGAAVAAAMWAVSALLSRLRGRDSLGFGDVILVLSTVGVPVAVAGVQPGDPFALSLLVAVSWGMMTLAAGGVAALVVWYAEARRSGQGSGTPFAFIPGLVAGAALVWVLL